MDWKTYKKTTANKFIGRKVKSLCKMSNGLYIFPAGMTFTIKGKGGGFELLSDPCPRCGIQACVNKVEPTAVELITGQEALWPGKVERI